MPEFASDPRMEPEQSYCLLVCVIQAAASTCRTVGGLPNTKRTRRSYTRLITPLSSKTLVGWKVELVTLGFDFDGLCFLVPEGVSLVFAQILVA